MNLQVYSIPVSRSVMKNYSYVLVDPGTRDALAIDPAWEPEKIELVFDREHVRCRTILLTHAHSDHVDLADYFAKKFDCRVIISRVEARYYDFKCTGLFTVEDGQWISFGQTGITPILTPGHTAGSLCFRIGNNLFTGDTLFAEGCGMCVERGADPKAMYDSLERLKAIVSQETVIFPGHSYGMPPGQTFRHILNNNIYLQFANVQDFVAYRMRKMQNGWLKFK